MRRFAIFVCLCFLGLGSLSTAAQTAKANDKAEDVPPTILAGLEALKVSPDEAVKAWLKGGPLEGDKDAASQGNMIRRIQDFYGAYAGYEVVGTREISSRSRILYIVIGFEKGPLYAKFLLFKPHSAWMLTAFDCNTKYENIFPDELARATRR